MTACIVVGLALSAQAELIHRYTFDGNLNDVVGTRNGVPTTAGTNIEAPQYVADTPTGAVAAAPTRSMEVGMNLGSMKSGFQLNSAVINTAAGSHSVWIKPDTNVTYTPATWFGGEAFFNYAVTNAYGSDTGYVTVTVVPARGTVFIIR